MSNSADSGIQPDRAALKRLEGVVGKALKRLEATRSQADEASARSAELEVLVRKFTADQDEPARLLTRLRELEAENADLRTRVEKGREGVERLLAKIRFMEEQR